MMLFVADAVGREKLAMIVVRTGQTVPFFALIGKGAESERRSAILIQQ
jgi:hypothetical protein